jgi:hypothetical protein
LTSQSKIELNVATITYLKNQIIELKFKDNIIVTENDAREIDEAYVKLAQNKPFTALIDSRDIRGDLTTEARNFFATDKLVRNLRKGQAIVVNSLANKLLAEFYMKFHKPFDPVKIFNNDYENALNWLLSLPLDKEY